MENKDQNEINTSRFRASPDVVYNRVGEQGVLVHMGTNQIYELNRTGARFWELLDAGDDLVEIQWRMLQEFDVAEADLTAEIDTLLTLLKSEDLVIPYR